MGATQCWVVVLAAVLCVTAVLAAKPGPKNIRYPDKIVEPKVKCTQEGVFPHPRDCKWYYRCVDRMNIGYFWTYYFECEPGTVFSDELDQCVHPFLAGPPCGDEPTTAAPTTIPPSPPTPAPVIPCTGVEGTCRTYDICEPEKQKKFFCDKIKCPLRTPELSCAEGYSFDMDARLCAKLPEAHTLCGAQITINITEEGQVPCSINNLRPATDFIKKVFCDKFVLCDANKKYKGEKELCRNYYECQRVGNSFQAYKRSCPLGLLYSYDEDKCLAKPTAAELC